MFALLWERQRRVLLIRFWGVLTSQDISDMDLAIIEFVGRHGRSATIYDFTSTTAVAIPESGFVARRSQAPLSPGFTRVIVAPREDLHRRSLEFATQQTQLGFMRPHVTRTLDEAFAILGLGESPLFETVSKPTQG